MKAIDDCRLYGILDTGYVAATDLARVARSMCEGGIDILQLRAKHATPAEIERWGREIHVITLDSNVPLIINDHPEVSAAIQAEGTHVGQDDRSLAEVRKIVPAGTLVGKSTHSLSQAIAGAAEGADYIGFGPLFATPTKPDYVAIGTGDIRAAHEKVRIPIFCIGGIKKANLHSVRSAGARRVVIVSGILQAEDIPAYIDECRRMLSNPSIIT